MKFLRCNATINETQTYWYTTETKEQLKQWISPGKTAPKKAKIVLSTGKVMATVSWDLQGMIYLEKSKAVTGLYYAELILLWSDLTTNCGKN